MKIVGYSNRLSVQPGESVQFMVSSELSTYRADMVRLIHGDESLGGPGFLEEELETPVNGNYPGRIQALKCGSYVKIPGFPTLNSPGSFTIQAWIYPTTPLKGLQGILTKAGQSSEVDYGLFVGTSGGLTLRIGDKCDVSVPVSLNAMQWYFVAAVYDASKGEVRLYQETEKKWPRDGSRSSVCREVDLPRIESSSNSLIISGYMTSEDNVSGCFNGKIDSPKVFDIPLSPHEIEELTRDVMSERVQESVIASWDFSKDISSSKVSDISPNQLHGTAVNMPARAMTSHNWKGVETDYRNVPNEYSAIYFHDDDLEDACWDTDFEFKVPESLASGVYAARLTSEGHEDYVPFFVRPIKGTATAPILFLAPTASYLAYANSHPRAHPKNIEMYRRLYGGKDPVEYPLMPQDKFAIENNLLSLYDLHSDGSGVCYSSMLRPITNMRPKYLMGSLGLGKGAAHQFNADLHLLDWMETKGYQFDIVTDEDLHIEGQELLSRYVVVVTGTHPEYWSAQMLDALENYQSDGGRLMYLGGNGFYWVTSFDPERPHIIEVRRWRGTELWEADPGEYHHSTTGEIGGLWRFRGRPPQRLTGVGFSAQGSDYSIPYELQSEGLDPRARFIFDGIENDETIGDFGLVMGGAAGYEVDRADISLGTPPHALVIATATGFSDMYQHVVEEMLLSDSRQGGTVNPLVKGDLVYFEGPNGGAVFSVGSIAWCGSLSYNNYDNNVSKITDNVLKRFSSEEPIY